MAAGTFRQDLYYRLNVFPLQIPPLRERADDIPLLVHYFARRYAGKIGRMVSRVSRATMERLAGYAWPGNIRELENVIERAVILSTGAELEVAAELLPMTASSLSTMSPAIQVAEPPGSVGRAAPVARSSSSRSTSSEAGPSSLVEVERQHILDALIETGWRIDRPSGAARALGLNPSTLRSRMQKLGIRRSTESA